MATYFLFYFRCTAEITDDESLFNVLVEIFSTHTYKRKMCACIISAAAECLLTAIETIVMT